MSVRNYALIIDGEVAPYHGEKVYYDGMVAIHPSEEILKKAGYRIVEYVKSDVEKIEYDDETILIFTK